MTKQLQIFSFATALWLLAAGTIGHAQEMTFRVSASDLKVIGRGLEALPFSVAMGTIVTVQAQIDAQSDPRWRKYQSATEVQESCPGIGWAVTCPRRVKP
jgi:hypothetical protein